MKRPGSWAVLLWVFALTFGCRIQGGLTGGSGSGSGNSGGGGGGGGGSNENAGGATGGGSASGGGAGSGAGGPSCTNPANHCLEEGEVFVADSAFDSGYITVSLAKQTGQANAQGEADYLKIASGENIHTKYMWQTRPATDADIQVGRMAISLDVQENGVYRAARTRDDAKSNSQWFLARIINVDNKAQGYVIVSGPYKVAVGGIRVPVKDDSPSVVISGPEDKHFIHDDYWFVGDADLPASGYINVRVAVAVKPPTKETGNEGQFILIPSGKIVWSKYAWKTRIASKDELKTGVYAFMLDTQRDGVYRAPESREDAFGGSQWFAAKIVDTGQMYKGVLGVAGGYNVAPEGMRVRR